MPLPTTVRLFISYSHDSAEHTLRVRALADRLRADGIDAWIDQYVQDPNEGWIHWMRNQVKEADRVLLIFTEAYQRRFDRDEEEGKGLGATFEGVIVTQALYESGGRNAKFRPVIFSEQEETFIPEELRRFNRYRVDTQDNYQNLLRWLYGAPRIVAPTVGMKPDLPPEPAPELFPSRPDEPPCAKRLEPAPDAPADLLNVLTSGEFPKQAELRQAELRAINHAPVEAERNPVDCTVFAPSRVECKQVGLLQVFLHTPEDRKQTEAAAVKFDPESKERGHRSLVLDAPIGTIFGFDVEIEGFVLPERMDTLIWTGHPQSATFRFEVPEDCKWGQHTGTVRISKDVAPVGRISFQIEVVRDARDARNRPVGKEARHYHACFCSYSSFDREEMLKRAQGLQAAGLETFIDVLKLRPGDIWNPKIFAAIDESDLFVVIWSKNARDSKWVKKESRYALKRYKQHGSPDFRPIPVEGPPIASVPRGLQAYHFNDELLGLIRAAELERREREKAQRDISCDKT